MSAYSNWKYGGLSDTEFNSAMKAECYDPPYCKNCTRETSYKICKRCEEWHNQIDADNEY